MVRGFRWAYACSVASDAQAFRVGDEGHFAIPGKHGWLYWRLTDALDIRVQLADEDGTLRPVGIVIRSASSSSPVTGTDLRNIPMGRLEGALRNRDIDAIVRRAWSARGSHDFRPEKSSPEQAASIAETTPVEDPPFGLKLPLHEISGGRRDDMFYLHVELLYAMVSQRSKRPAAEIAAANNVKPTTVHRWLKEARRRRKDLEDLSPEDAEIWRMDVEEWKERHAEIYGEPWPPSET